MLNKHCIRNWTKTNPPPSIHRPRILVKNLTQYQTITLIGIQHYCIMLYTSMHNNQMFVMRTWECSSAPVPVEECFVKILQWHLLAGNTHHHAHPQRTPDNTKKTYQQMLGESLPSEEGTPKDSHKSGLVEKNWLYAKYKLPVASFCLPTSVWQDLRWYPLPQTSIWRCVDHV